MEISKVYIKKGHEKRLFFGHHWIFSNELTHIPQLEPGSLVEVFNDQSRSFGFGFFNPSSLISVRLLFTAEAPDKSLFVTRIQSALNYREKLFHGSKVYRLIFGESDFLPGLIIDRYGDYLALQSLSAGIERNLPQIVEALLEVMPDIKGIYAKNISNLRLMEGLELGEYLLYGTMPEENIVDEEGIKLSISLEGGQKTGYYLDQRINRKFIRELSDGLRVLDCYTNQGGFALNASLGGAEEVTAVDTSQPARDKAALNSKINSFGNITLVNADVADYLEKSIGENKEWDLIILDPPAFAKNRKKIPVAKAGYGKINRLAMKLIPSGGFLASSSCSQQIDENDFLEIIHKEASKQGKQLRLVFRGLQSPCHPILTAMPETKYLKFFVHQII